MKASQLLTASAILSFASASRISPLQHCLVIHANRVSCANTFLMRQLATTRADEAELLRFIASLAPIRVFQSQAETPEALWIPEPETIAAPPRLLYIWPQMFPWSPTYKQTGGPECPPESAGFFYIENAQTAPVLQLSRTDLSQHRHGRIYWASDFSAPYGLSYDRAAFSRFVDSVWRWIRKVGKRASRDQYSPYYLPDAHKLHAGGIA